MYSFLKKKYISLTFALVTLSFDYVNSVGCNSVGRMVNEIPNIFHKIPKISKFPKIMETYRLLHPVIMTTEEIKNLLTVFKYYRLWFNAASLREFLSNCICES